jgi:hypothetical protein
MRMPPFYSCFLGTPGPADKKKQKKNSLKNVSEREGDVFGGRKSKECMKLNSKGVTLD